MTNKEKFLGGKPFHFGGDDDRPLVYLPDENDGQIQLQGSSEYYASVHCRHEDFVAVTPFCGSMVVRAVDYNTLIFI